MFTQFPFPLSLAMAGHVVAGTIALAVFLVPLLSRKGGKLHVRTGWVYAGAMIVVAASSFVVTPWRYFLDPAGTDASRKFSFFLFFIAVFSLACVQQGIFVCRAKRRSEKLLSMPSLALPLFLAVVSAMTLAWGLASQTWLFVVFAGLAGRTAQKQIVYWIKPAQHPQGWWIFHLENMFVACIATVTAFVVTALPRLLPWGNFNSIWVWLAPTFLLVPWLVASKRKYETKFRMGK